MRKKIVAGNWKMNTTIDEAVLLAENINRLLANSKKDIDNVSVILFPPYPFIHSVSKIINTHRIGIGSQNIANKAQGAFTGEVSAKMIASMNAGYTIIGHSERRIYYNETNDLLRQKIDLALENNLTVVFCCGEQEESRDSGEYFKIIENQLSTTILNLSANQMSHIIVAYEPVWAIGTGKTASPEQAQEIHAFIRMLIKNKFNDFVAENTSILYGGSCKPSNAKDLFSQTDIDGGLIGGASLKAEDFIQIIESF
ncbi:MAG TPA: triose-phosphate isomerase [Bacteroidales bacterium]|nr:triose-phosphate isomerase [Bacteroidales bacterium]